MYSVFALLLAVAVVLLIVLLVIHMKRCDCPEPVPPAPGPDPESSSSSSVDPNFGIIIVSWQMDASEDGGNTTSTIETDIPGYESFELAQDESRTIFVPAGTYLLRQNFGDWDPFAIVVFGLDLTATGQATAVAGPGDNSTFRQASVTIVAPGDTATVEYHWTGGL